MPIASKLFYFQRPRGRHSPPPEPPPEPPDPRRRRRDAPVSASGHRRLHPRAHHKLGQDRVPRNQRGNGECGASTGSIIEPAGSRLFGSRPSSSASDDRLPDAVQQARERLLQRLRSVDLTGTRQTATASETIWAPADIGVSASRDGRSGNPTNCFESSASLAAYKVQESSTEPFGNAGNSKTVVLCSKAFSKLQQEAFRGTKEAGNVESSVDCSICLEKCGDEDGLIQLHCKHIFHSYCLERWLRSHGDCPYCRASVFLTTE